MISLWVTAENIHHQFYGTTARHQIVGNTTSIGSIFQIVPRIYDGFKIKKIFFMYTYNNIFAFVFFFYTMNSF